MPFANIYQKARTVNFNDLTRQHITSSVPKTQKATKTGESKIIFTQNFELTWPKQIFSLVRAHPGLLDIVQGAQTLYLAFSESPINAV